MQPPKYKLKIADKSEEQALVLVCEHNSSLYTAHGMLAMKIKLLVAEKTIKGKTQYSVALEAHEAFLFDEMMDRAAKVVNSPYNQSWRRQHSEGIHLVLSAYHQQLQQLKHEALKLKH